jgi:NhaP-type Na+/H+ or K+/H+ antiporter
LTILHKALALVVAQIVVSLVIPFVTTCAAEAVPALGLFAAVAAAVTIALQPYRSI